MSKMKEHSNSFQRDARNLAEATLRLVMAALTFVDIAKRDTDACNDLVRALDDAEGEAKNIMAKTIGA